MKGGFYAVVLAGGSGTRLWPLSRATSPKQLLDLLGSGSSLIVDTIKRVASLIKPKRSLVVTTATQLAEVSSHLEAASVKDGFEIDFIVEPKGRGTAAAIGLAALRVAEKDPKAMMMVLPSDHLIRPARALHTAIKAARGIAASDELVLLGVRPTAPYTRYGYIGVDSKSVRDVKGVRVFSARRFVEKPKKDAARRYVKSGNYLWNTGIFVWKAKRILQEIELHMPALYKELYAIRNGCSPESAYERIKDASIDRGVLERTGELKVVEAGFTWADLGSWASIKRVLKADKQGNVMRGTVVGKDCSDSLILGSGRPIAAVGLEEMVVVDTPEALLVTSLGRADQAASLAEAAVEKGHLSAVKPDGSIIKKRWGKIEELSIDTLSEVRKLTVLPGCSLTLIGRGDRSIHWLVTYGNARLTGPRTDVRLGADQSVEVADKMRYRLSNASRRRPLEMIEIRRGSALAKHYSGEYEEFE